MIYDRLLILIWSVLLAFFAVFWLGTTHILSRIFGVVDLKQAADILFFVFCGLFALGFYAILPRPLSLKLKMAASLPPFIVLSYFIVSSIN